MRIGASRKATRTMLSLGELPTMKATGLVFVLVLPTELPRSTVLQAPMQHTQSQYWQVVQQHICRIRLCWLLGHMCVYKLVVLATQDVCKILQPPVADFVIALMWKNLKQVVSVPAVGQSGCPRLLGQSGVVSGVVCVCNDALYVTALYFGREVLAGIAGAEVDYLFETKGMDWMDKGEPTAAGRLLAS